MKMYQVQSSQDRSLVIRELEVVSENHRHYVCKITRQGSRVIRNITMDKDSVKLFITPEEAIEEHLSHQHEKINELKRKLDEATARYNLDRKQLFEHLHHFKELSHAQV